MKPDNLLLIVAVIAVAMSIISAGFTYFSIGNLITKISGYATGGTANLSIESAAIVNFTTDTINWASGRVNPSSAAASLVTTGSGSVSGGNWTAQTGLILQNDGNVNVTLNLSGTKTAASFIGGTNPVYQWNITNSESGSCVNGTGSTGTVNLNNFHNVNTTTALICTTFQFVANNDTIRIDFNVTIAENAPSGQKTDTITATAWSA